MFKGFYNLTSGMLTQGRNLDVVANNMVNVSTIGYKTDRFTASTFQDVLISRVGNRDKSNAEEIGSTSYMLVPSEITTNFTQGSLEQTGMVLDFAIEGEGFFAIETDDGIGYTRAGNFMLDEEGYLCLPGQGRVLSSEEEPIRLVTDKIEADLYGHMFTKTGGYLGQLGVFTFADLAQLSRNEQGLFITDAEATGTTSPIHWKTLERSNVTMVQQMAEMMTSQRALQSAAKVSKMYDQLITKTANEVGRL